jgi:hypothetical protein
MAEEIAGKIFSTPEEAGVSRPTDEELADARKQFDEFQEQIDRVPESDRWRVGKTASSANPNPTPHGPIV